MLVSSRHLKILSPFSPFSLLVSPSWCVFVLASGDVLFCRDETLTTLFVIVIIMIVIVICSACGHVLSVPLKMLLLLYLYHSLSLYANRNTLWVSCAMGAECCCTVLSSYYFIINSFLCQSNVSVSISFWCFYYTTIFTCSSTTRQVLIARASPWIMD